MEAKARSFTFIGNEGVISVPFFQRDYVWKKDNWEDLLKDLSNRQKNHFLGSLILKHQPAVSGEPKELLVIDGQQRLTTLSILVKALYDTFPDRVKENCKEAIRMYLFYKKSKTSPDYYVKLNHSHADAPSFTLVMKYGLDNFDSLPETENRVFGCYRYYIEEFNKMTLNDKSSLFDSLLDDQDKILVVIDLDTNDEEQAIFDTINSAGVRLSSSDIIKNALYQNIIKASDQIQAVELYNETWKEIFLRDKETIKFWELQRATGRLTRDNLEILLHAIAVIKGFYDPEKNTLAELSKLYKERIASLSSFYDLKKFVIEIRDYAKIYKEKILVFGKSTLYSFNNDEQRLFHILQVLEVSTFHTFILSLYKVHHENQTEVIRMLRLLEKFVVRRFISGLETKSFNKLAKDFIQNPSSLESKLSEMPDDYLKNGLKHIINKHAALLLFWVELMRRHVNSKIGLADLKYDYTLEHIMPQKWEQYWPLLPGKSNQDGTLMSVEASKDDRYKKVYWIGNMTLLTSSLNTSVRNFEYTRKMEGEARKKGIRAYADLYITKFDLVEKYDAGDKIWDEDKIIERTTRIIDEVLAIW